MELYLDTADIRAIERLAPILPLAGVTTNPSIVAAGRMPLRELLPALRSVLGPQARLFAQVLGHDADTMVAEARQLRELDADIVIKVPVTRAGLTAIQQLARDRIPTLGTAVYTPLQGLLAAQAGAEYIAPYVNRIDAQGGNGIASVRELQQLLQQHVPTSAVLTASFKTPRQVLDCLLAGCTALTIPVDIAEQMLTSPAVDAAIAKFDQDWAGAFGDNTLG